MQERTHRAARAARRAMAEASVVNAARMQELRFHKNLLLGGVNTGWIRHRESASAGRIRTARRRAAQQRLCHAGKLATKRAATLAGV